MCTDAEKQWQVLGGGKISYLSVPLSWPHIKSAVENLLSSGTFYVLWVVLFMRFSQCSNRFSLLTLLYCCCGFFFILASMSCHLFHLKKRFQFRILRALKRLNNLVSV